LDSPENSDTSPFFAEQRKSSWQVETFEESEVLRDSAPEQAPQNASSLSLWIFAIDRA